MTAYFGMYGVTMTTNPDLFWSEKGIMMMPYVKAFGAATTLPGFFARMTGLGFIVMVLGKHFGASDKTFSKQAVAFHVLSTKWFFGLATMTVGRRQPAIVTPWVWKLQVLVNIMLAVWGASPRRREVGHQEGLSRAPFRDETLDGRVASLNSSRPDDRERASRVL